MLTKKEHSDSWWIDTLGAQTLDKRVLVHTFDPVSYVPCSMQHKGKNRWFYTCSCPAFSTLVLSLSVTPRYLVTSTLGSLTAWSGFQLTEWQWATKKRSSWLSAELILHKLWSVYLLFASTPRAVSVREVIIGKMLHNSMAGITFFFSEFSFNCTNGLYNGCWRYGDKRSGPEIKPLSVEFQTKLIFFFLHTQINSSLDLCLHFLNASCCLICLCAKRVQ